MSKNCIHCGAALPDEAAFCHACAQSQLEKQLSMPPKPRCKRPVIAAAILAAAALILGAVYFIPRQTDVPSPDESTISALTSELQEETPSPAESPEPTSEPRVFDEGGAEVIYETMGKKFRILATFHLREEGYQYMAATYQYKTVMDPGIDRLGQTQLFVYSEDMSYFYTEDFEPLIKEIRLTTEGLGNARHIKTEEVGKNPGDSAALAYTTFLYNSENGSNKFCWEIEMHNGDIIRLHQLHSVVATASDTAVYTYQEYPMDTIEQLQSLIDTISAEVSYETEVTIYLPPIVYEGELELNTRGFTLAGTTGSIDGKTTFTDTVFVYSSGNTSTHFQNMVFDTRWSGTGLHASAAVYAENCEFRNCTIGAYADTNGWINATGCTFENNEVGMEINNPQFSNLTETTFLGLRFYGNDTAFRLTETGYSLPFSFEDCQFSGNRENVVNLDTNEISYIDCKFE